jgi:hypothetical protein
MENISHQKSFNYLDSFGLRLILFLFTTCGKFTNGVDDTGDKFANFINDNSGTGGIFTTGFVDSDGAP